MVLVVLGLSWRHSRRQVLLLLGCYCVRFAVLLASAAARAPRGARGCRSHRSPRRRCSAAPCDAEVEAESEVEVEAESGVIGRTHLQDDDGGRRWTARNSARPALADAANWKWGACEALIIADLREQVLRPFTARRPQGPAGKG